MTEQCIPSEDEEPLSFGSPASSVHHGNNAKKERKRAHLKKEVWSLLFKANKKFGVTLAN